MKRYFVDGKEVCQEEAKRIEAENSKYLKSSDLNDWFKVKYIIIIETLT